MRTIVFYFTILTMFIACKESQKNTQNGDLSKKVVINSSKKDKDSDSLLLTAIKRDTSIPSKESKKVYPILDKELIGLGVRDSLATDVFKRYWVDFNAICYPSAFSLYIDASAKKIYAYDYSFCFEGKNFSIQDLSLSYIFHIESYQEVQGNYRFKINKVEHLYSGEEVIQLDKIQISFSKVNLVNQIYKLKIKESEEAHYSNILRYNIYAFKSIENKFEKEDCGDFDG
ncbi:hypothetical protein [Aquimarina sediminis]|uniref:hypothetical protein n=1 Tax=Aquimarina sediminis TaxID=2070536 RepID=UPI000FFF0252|nr:hypothetical protein [Aquimarina sediminis]